MWDGTLQLSSHAERHCMHHLTTSNFEMLFPQKITEEWHKPRAPKLPMVLADLEVKRSGHSGAPNSKEENSRIIAISKILELPGWTWLDNPSRFAFFWSYQTYQNKNHPRIAVSWELDMFLAFSPAATWDWHRIVEPVEPGADLPIPRLCEMTHMMEWSQMVLLRMVLEWS